MVAYRFEDSRGGRCVARHLSGFSGILQVDGHGAYTSMVKEQLKSGCNETMTLAGAGRMSGANLRTAYRGHQSGGDSLGEGDGRAVDVGGRDPRQECRHPCGTQTRAVRSHCRPSF